MKVVAEGRRREGRLTRVQREPIVPLTKKQEALDLWKRYLLLIRKTDMGCIPKDHMMIHNTMDQYWHGGMFLTGTFLDEGLNKVLKGLAKWSHSLVFEILILNKAPEAMRRYFARQSKRQTHAKL